jgi:hypothetical protein
MNNIAIDHDKEAKTMRTPWFNNYLFLLSETYTTEGLNEVVLKLEWQLTKLNNFIDYAKDPLYTEIRKVLIEFKALVLAMDYYADHYRAEKNKSSQGSDEFLKLTEKLFENFDLWRRMAPVGSLEKVLVMEALEIAGQFNSIALFSMQEKTRLRGNMNFNYGKKKPNKSDVGTQTDYYLIKPAEVPERVALNRLETGKHARNPHTSPKTGEILRSPPEKMTNSN